MSASRPLPVILPTIPGQRWSCHSCGQCCRSLVGHLTKEERQRLDQQQWARELGTAPYVRCGPNWSLNKREDGACVFLDEDNRCRIHARFGEEAKPIACRIFPFSVRAVPDGWQASFRFDCPSATSSQGQPLAQHRHAVSQIVRQLDRPSKIRREATRLQRGVRATTEETEMVLQHFLCWFQGSEGSLYRKLLAAARITATLAEATLQKVRGSRFQELLTILFEDASSQPVPDPPTRRQDAMLRQLAFAHAEHLTLSQWQMGWLARWRKRWQQLSHARRFLAGKGAVPRLPGSRSDTTFEAVAAVSGPDVNGTSAVNDLLQRYLIARLDSRSVFGRGYYGWPVVRGLGALWLSVAVIGWHARYLAAIDQRSVFGWDDVATAVGIVDRAATRLPALGTTAERARATYLMDQDGVARLLLAYTPVSTES